jgi:hypothetical protein
MVNPQEDFIQHNKQDVRTASLVDAIVSTKVGEDRKSILTSEQALAIARARAYADSFARYDDEGNEIEPPLMILHAICSYLENTAMSVKGKGMDDLVKILSARTQSEDANRDLMRIQQRFMG